MRMAVVVLLAPLLLQKSLHGLGGVVSVGNSRRWRARWWVALSVLVLFINVHGQALMMVVVTTGGGGAAASADAHHELVLVLLGWWASSQRRRVFCCEIWTRHGPAEAEASGRRRPDRVDVVVATRHDAKARKCL